MVHMISTFHIDDTMAKRYRTKAVIEGVQTKQKPLMIDDYNLHMEVRSVSAILWIFSQIFKVIEESILLFTSPKHCKC